MHQPLALRIQCSNLVPHGCDVLPIPHDGIHEGHRNNPGSFLVSDMPNRNTQIYNVTTQSHVKLNQAERAVADGLCAWLDPDNPIRGMRKLTLAEMVEIRAERAAQDQEKRDPLYKRSEIPGLIFRWPESVTWKMQHEAAQRGIIRAAQECRN